MIDDTFEIAVGMEPEERGELIDPPSTCPTPAMAREYLLAVRSLREEASRLDRVTMAAVLRELERASAACMGESAEGYRAMQLVAAELELGIDLTMEQFEAIFIDGTAQVVDGEVIHC